jgi:hypothetical protein
LSRRVRFTNRFTEQAIDLWVSYPSVILVAADLEPLGQAGFARLPWTKDP